MRQLEDLVRYEPANSSLAFRERGYDPDERATLLRDVVALANAAVPGPRFMVVGVLDAAGGKRQVRGIERAAPLIGVVIDVEVFGLNRLEVEPAVLHLVLAEVLTGQRRRGEPREQSQTN